MGQIIPDSRLFAAIVDRVTHGDRAGQFVDPFGHKWFVATHVEDVAPDEMAKRAAAAMGRLTRTLTNTKGRALL